jgi:hypothetical protein
VRALSCSILDLIQPDTEAHRLPGAAPAAGFALLCREPLIDALEEELSLLLEQLREPRQCAQGHPVIHRGTPKRLVVLPVRVRLWTYVAATSAMTVPQSRMSCSSMSWGM